MRGGWLIYPILIAVGMASFPTKKVIDQIEKAKDITIPKDIMQATIGSDIKLPIGNQQGDVKIDRYNSLSSLLDNQAKHYTSSVIPVKKEQQRDNNFFKGESKAERPMPSIAIMGRINNKIMVNVISIPDGKDPKVYPLMKTLKVGSNLDGWVVKSLDPLRFICKDQEIEVETP